MGYYIEGPATGKAEFLEKTYGASRLRCARRAQMALQEGLGVIVVVDNGVFEAAGLVHNEEELERFSDPLDKRPKKWLSMPRAQAEELSGFRSREAAGELDERAE